jgi:hypothetical protein
MWGEGGRRKAVFLRAYIQEEYSGEICSFNIVRYETSGKGNPQI